MGGERHHAAVWQQNNHQPQRQTQTQAFSKRIFTALLLVHLMFVVVIVSAYALKLFFFQFFFHADWMKLARKK